MRFKTLLLLTLTGPRTRLSRYVRLTLIDIHITKRLRVWALATRRKKRRSVFFNNNNNNIFKKRGEHKI